MEVFHHSQFNQHECVCFFSDKTSGLEAIIAIHNTKLGPAMGGCRMRPYKSEDDALSDALRLSRGMTYKNALAGLSHGGGKAVIIGDPEKDKTQMLLHAFARCVDRLGGRYITGEDSNIGTRDIAAVSEVTSHVRNLPLDQNGDPSVFTSWGVFQSMKTALLYKSGSKLRGASVAIEGLGNVGMDLCRLVHEAGATLFVSDIDARKVASATNRFGAHSAQVGTLHAADVEVYAPCALGGGLNAQTIPEIKARVIAGAANNQLATPEDGLRLKAAGILYCPDYLVNAGGVLSVGQRNAPFDRQAAYDRAAGITTTLVEVFKLAERLDVPTSAAADTLAERRFA
jgi:leucine dehydrogenase